ncbi:Uu.00g110090.m01.CDS01 [Anthostomella pinea]|uniref:Uu.00g110090.m01.CDS01 n=1 Tax=Anthostomella pinea TaxID=933095 RepID=A0AAI8YG91_9PEZI|nr:Uu.00g110090.m01.CDS01 [Anthostomella pinea]
MAAIADLIWSEGVTVTIATPTEYVGWIRRAREDNLRTARWQVAISGGEFISEALQGAFKGLRKSDLQLVNCYGPAEVTFACAYSVIPYATKPSSNCPLAVLPNYRILVVDSDLKPVSTGESGQILIGGGGVASGYLNDSSLTQSAFVTLAGVSTSSGNEGGCVYHMSGDSGWLDADGHLMLEGRVCGSTQIKKGGIRIDLRDIENTICRVFAQTVSQAIVSLRYGPASEVPFLVAFIVFAKNEPPTSRKEFLSELPDKLPLPRYMRPSRVQELDTIPTVGSGKVDRGALDSLDLGTERPVVSNEPNGDLDSIEEILFSWWEEAIPGGGPIFLGKAVLRHLIGDSGVTKVHCIAIHKPQRDLPSIFNHAKVHTYSGDLEATLLGLPSESARDIFGDADAIIHIGADVSFMKTYRSLRPVNIASTKELARLCAPRRIPFHFVSSATVTRLTGQEAVGPVSLRQWPPQSDGFDGYTATKWASEVFLENMNEYMGLPVFVYRPSSVTGDDAPESDAVSNFIRYAKKMNMLPQVGNLTGYLDFVHVDEVARCITSNLREVVHLNIADNRVQFLQILGTSRIRVDEIPRAIESATGTPVRVVATKEWAQAAIEAGMNPLLAAYFEREVTNQALLPNIM